MLVFAAPSYGSLAAPTLTGPANGSTSDAAPLFTWSAVSGADHYAFQLGGATGFNPPKYTTSTMNTRLALVTSIPSGTYTWRVAAVTATGGQGPWSATHTFTLDWADVAQPQSPADGATLTYPEPLLLNWTTVPGAVQYQLSVSNSDPNQGANAVNGFPVTTEASAYSIPSRLSDGEYWWQVTPLDAEGNQGTPSPWFSFTWSWPNDTTLTLNDLDPSAQVFDPQFSWTPVAGAAYYKVDVNTDPNFPSGSNVCCNGYTVATSLTPTTLLPAAQNYYWRVTPYDSSLNAGEPTVYSDGNGNPKTFTTTYDAGVGAVTGLSMVDPQDAPIAWTQSGVSTDDPIVSWNPVPGAASYEVEVALYSNSTCDWSSKPWDVTTVTTSWTPLGSGHGMANPWPGPQSVATDSNGLIQGQSYCVRVRAQRNTDTANHTVSGTPTDIGDESGPSFTFTGFPTGSACSPSCSSGYLGTGDYLLPQTGQVTSGMPLFTWNPIAGAQSYYVVVATDASFQNVVDYAFTQTPAYAPRNGFQVTDYPDATYYWAVLPATGFDGTGVSARPDFAPAETFQKQSDAPTLTAPADNSTITTWPVFQWSPVDGALLYHVEVATDQNFSNVVDNTTVDETSYTAASTYPANQKLYWRVQAEAKTSSQPVGLAWSAVGHFTKTLPVPSFTSPTLFTNATTGDAIPVWQWNPVAGAVSYDAVLVCAVGMSCQNANGIDTTAVAMTHSTGTQTFHWEVRANFPTVQNGYPSSTVPGNYTALQPYTRTIAAPTGLVASIGGLRNFSMSWSPKAGAKHYLFEVSTSQSVTSDGTFANKIGAPITTDTTSAAPDLMGTFATYQNGGTLYWHVAAVDADGNVGAYSPVQTMSLPMKLAISTTAGAIFPKQSAKFTVTIKHNGSSTVVSGVTVRATGAGITAKTLKTGTSGKVTFTVKPTKAGKITLKATKSGCSGATTTVTVL